MKKPEAATSGLNEERPQTTGSSTAIVIFYYILRLFARPETRLFYFYVKSTAVGAILFFMSAVAVGADSVTAVTYVGWQRNEKATVRPSGDTARQLKGKKPIATPKTVVGML